VAVIIITAQLVMTTRKTGGGNGIIGGVGVVISAKPRNFSLTRKGYQELLIRTITWSDRLWAFRMN
jgi:hypothetical protein